MTRQKPVELQRKTGETDIRLRLLLDGTRSIQVETGIGFFDHMLISLAFWAGWDLEIACQGDLQVDTHHTIEDMGLVLGEAFGRVLGDSGEIERFGSALVPLDEALSQVVVDLSGRPFCVFEAVLNSERVGAFETAMTGHFFRSFATGARVTLHVHSCYGENDHHMIESMFKGLGLALRQAAAARAGGVASTKGSI